MKPYRASYNKIVICQNTGRKTFVNSNIFQRIVMTEDPMFIIAWCFCMQCGQPFCETARNALRAISGKVDRYIILGGTAGAENDF